MITENTVFVLGAGASFDFGFPLGDKLRQEIIQGFISNDSQTYMDIENIAKVLCGEWPKEFKDYIPAITEFANKLRLDAGYSIDAFLERFKESYLLIGKLAIALILAKHENPNVFYHSNNDHWYRIIYKRMKEGASIDTFCHNRVSFITFNYDRSLEHFLYSGFSSFHEKITENHIKDIITQIPIVHIYGQLDPLPWQNPDGRSYGASVTLNQLKRYKKNISIIFENIAEETNSNFQKAFSLLQKAARIYILGFGFHPDNFSRLKLGDLTLRYKIMATSYNLEQRAFNSIIPLCKGGIRTIESLKLHRNYSSGLCLSQMKVYDFVKELTDLNLLD